MEAGDEPFAVASALALHRLARFARERVKVVLTGDGADELLAGYPWRHEPAIGRGSPPGVLPARAGHDGARSVRGRGRAGRACAAQLRSRLTRLPAAARRALRGDSWTRSRPRRWRPCCDAVGRGAWRARPGGPTRCASATRAPTGRDEVNRRLRADFATTLVDEMLTKVDRMTMAAGLEARVPFLDRGLVEWAFRLPGRLKVRGSGKRILRRALAGALPAHRRAPKHGFDVPLGAWLRGPLRALLLDTLSPEAVRRRGLLRERAVTRMVEAHLRGRGDHSRKLFSLIVLEMWLRRWTGPASPTAARPPGRLLRLATGRPRGGGDAAGASPRSPATPGPGAAALPRRRSRLLVATLPVERLAQRLVGVEETRLEGEGLAQLASASSYRFVLQQQPSAAVAQRGRPRELRQPLAQPVQGLVRLLEPIADERQVQVGACPPPAPSRSRPFISSSLSASRPRADQQLGQLAPRVEEARAPRRGCCGAPRWRARTRGGPPSPGRAGSGCRGRGRPWGRADRPGPGPRTRGCGQARSDGQARGDAREPGWTRRPSPPGPARCRTARAAAPSRRGAAPSAARTGGPARTFRRRERFSMAAGPGPSRAAAHHERDERDAVARRGAGPRPTRSRSVGARSTVLTTGATRTPEGTWPGIETTSGTRVVAL